MSEFKGTKGPWLIGIGDPNGVELNAYRIQADNIDRWDICAVWDDTPNAKANTLLISKAPEMLDQLNRIHGEIMRNDGVLDVEKWGSQIEQLIKEATCLE